MFNSTYLASANNSSDNLNPATVLRIRAACWRSPAPDQFYAGEPRPFMGDARFAFR